MARSKADILFLGALCTFVLIGVTSGGALALLALRPSRRASDRMSFED